MLSSWGVYPNSPLISPVKQINPKKNNKNSGNKFSFTSPQTNSKFTPNPPPKSLNSPARHRRIISDLTLNNPTNSPSNNPNNPSNFPASTSTSSLNPQKLRGSVDTDEKVPSMVGSGAGASHSLEGGHVKSSTKSLSRTESTLKCRDTALSLVQTLGRVQSSHALNTLLPTHPPGAVPSPSSTSPADEPPNPGVVESLGTLLAGATELARVLAGATAELVKELPQDLSDSDDSQDQDYDPNSSRVGEEDERSVGYLLTNHKIFQNLIFNNNNNNNNHMKYNNLKIKPKLLTLRIEERLQKLLTKRTRQVSLSL